MSGPVIVLDGKISKFPWPLFPKLKHPFSMGFRFDIPEQTGEFQMDLGLPEHDLELLEVTFTASGYKDTDCWSLVIEGAYVFRDIYTKEVGQVKSLKVVKKIPEVTSNNKFLFNNESGTAKTIWLDLDFACKVPIQYP